MQQDKIKEIVKQMTLEEKVALISTDGPCALYELKDHGIPSIIFADGATGVNASHISLDFLMAMQKRRAAAAAQQNLNQDSQQGAKQSGEAANMQGNEKLKKSMANPMGYVQSLIEMEPDDAAQEAAGNPIGEGFMQYVTTRRNPAGKIVSFPSGVNIGATFNEKLVNELGEAIGQEMNATNLDVVLGPNVDIARDPLGGRNYEMYGEDPLLVGRTAVAMVNGIQKTGTAACAKHFLANNQETRRQTKNT
ncbi:MAG: hypothetical protein II091_03400, partial [Lachnospiraceae bacterium]|nr:hypothetical protein [Lachnospiraceae bacterium]